MAAFLCASVAFAAPGELDKSFDEDGKALVNFGAQDFADAVSVLPGGGTVTAGGSYQPTGDVAAVARLQPNGALDPSLDGDGRATTNFGEANATAQGLAVSPDGRITLGGGRSRGLAPRDFLFTRLTAGGSPDPSFTPTTVDLGADEFLTEMARQPDGKVVAAGFSGSPGDFAVARVGANGGPDNSFSDDGKLTIPFGPSDDEAWALTIQPDGKIVVAGHGGPLQSMIVVRLKPDGTPDGTFGNGGVAFADFGADEFAYAVAVQPNGRILVAGVTTAAGGGDFAVARFDSGGALDTTFSGDGKLTAGFGANGESAAGVVVQQNGRIVVGGHGVPGGDNVLLRLNPNGSPDRSFGSAGELRIDFGSAFDYLRSMTIAPNGDIVGAGATSNNNDFSVFRVKGDPVARCTGVLATKVGTAKRDVLKGTRRRDVIAGLGGNDRLSGLGGNDLICGGAGKDAVKGGAAKDVLRGDAGVDTLRGGAGRDKLLGGTGRDRLFGGPGPDRLKGGPGKDQQRP